MSKLMISVGNGKFDFTASVLTRMATVAMALGLMLAPVHAEEYETKADIFELASNKITELGLYLTSKEGHDLKMKNPKILFLDVRTRAEVNFLGMPEIADANIPVKPITTILTNDGQSYQRVDNRDFVPAVAAMVRRKGLEADPVIFIMCRNGKGSAIAANLLAAHGYTKVYSLIDGYEGDFDASGKRTINGWRNAGLPWSYGIGKDRAYDYKAPQKAVKAVKVPKLQKHASRSF